MSSSFYNIGDWILTNQTISWSGTSYVGGEFQVLVGSSPVLACVSQNNYSKVLMLCSEQPFSIRYTVTASYTPEEHEISSYDTFIYGNSYSSGGSSYGGSSYNSGSSYGSSSYGGNSSYGSGSYGSSSYGSSSYGSSSYGGGSSYGYGSGTTYYYIYLDSLYTNNGMCYIANFNQSSSWFTSSYDMGPVPTGTAMIDAKGGPYVPPGPIVAGEATVDLEIQAPGQRLTFTSKELGTSVAVQVTGDTTVFISGEQPTNVDWEIFYDAKFGSALNAVLSVDSNFNSHYATPYNSEVIGSLLERNLSDQSGDNIYALDNIYGCRTYPQAGSISFSQFATGDIVSVSSWNNVYSRITIAKKASGNTLPFEVLFIWHNGWSAERTLIKRDGTQYGNDVTITGEFITGHIILSGTYPEEVTIAPFNGIIKIYKNDDPVISVSGSSGYSFSSSDTAIWMIFAIPN